MPLQAIQQALSVLAPIAVIIGVVIALLQLRNQARLRQFDTVMRLFLTFGQPSFLPHYRRVTTWQFDTYETFKKEASEDDHLSMMVVSVFYENMGLLYKRKLAPLELLDDLNSAPIITSWAKLKPIWVGLRAEYRQPQWAEFFEMLSEAIAKRLSQRERK